MEITSVSNIQTYSASITNTDNTQPTTVQENPVIQETPEEAIINEIEENAEPVETEKDAGKGVIRNLINGHFKGVADVRLRINFSEQIEALEQAELAKATGSGLSTLSDSINNEINAALGSEEIDEESSILFMSALETFNNEISQLRTNIPQSDNLISEIRSSFDNFVLSARPAVEEPVEPEPPITGETVLSEEVIIPDAEQPAVDIISEEEPQFSIDQFLTDLISTFDAELELLETTLANTSVLPEISEPSGNGKAFDKFMAIYNEMKSNINTNTENSQNNDIDITS